jgi:predicted SnoaL-like aldol condensation-catalyzing enzyme
MNDPKKNKELVKSFCANVFNKHDLANLDRFMREDYIQHNPDCPQGMAGFIEFFKTIFQALPDFKYSIKQIIAKDDSLWMYSRGDRRPHRGGMAWSEARRQQVGF